MRQNQVRLINLVIWFTVLSTGCNVSTESWSLPVRLGDSKPSVYSVLGHPSTHLDANELSPETEWFKNSGITISYDPFGNVATVIVHGPWNTRFLTYREPVFMGLRVTDSIYEFMLRLGKPTSEEDWNASQRTYIWRLSAYLIEVEYWVRDHLEDEIPVKSGEIFSIEISKAVGGK